MRSTKTLIGFATMGLAIAAIVQELSIPASERKWHGRIFGVPYDFRPPTPSRIKAAWWNPDSDALFTPREFGVGWSVNLHRVMRLIGERA